jgi:hypothetical protein
LKLNKNEFKERKDSRKSKINEINKNKIFKKVIIMFISKNNLLWFNKR